MITPILRLVVIYLALIAAVVAVFNRDRLSALLTGADQPARPAAVAPAPAPAVAPQTAPAGGAAVYAPSAPPVVQPGPVYGSDLQAPAPSLPAQAAPTQPPVAQPHGTATDTAIAGAVNSARSAYWAGDFDGAKAQLLALSRAHPDNADLLGELGNLYFALRDYPAAADAWYRAGLLLIDQGQGPQRRGFMQTLNMIAPDKAADLAAKAQGR